ncbi:sporulation phosphorelay system protein KapB [Oceanobacillus chungangensis]|uniref:Kinase n=1 Tax=Oceanobacillus chungangensis TaxID=1229152 RepID=A0A3D8PXZ5_9BACI|nr:sporulation phosphorelay system protein KapB [Oceanobacillus chungangensis]RDW20963.1 kinase [Oceanobacillus chungangensis]
MAIVNIGDIVKAHYHSGTYIGEVKEDRGEHYLIEVLAVYKHPLQGDLHNPGAVENVFFHERKALAHHEKMNVKKPAVHPYHEEIPSYGKSLKEAVSQYKEKLSKEDSAYNKLAIERLHGLEMNYYEKIEN